MKNCVFTKIWQIFKHFSQLWRDNICSVNLTMGYSRKNPNSGVEDMNFQGYILLKKDHVEIPGGQLKKKWNFKRWSRKKHFFWWNFDGSWFLTLEFPLKNNFVEFPGAKLSLKGKVTNIEILDFCSKNYVLNSPVRIFSGIVLHVL